MTILFLLDSVENSTSPNCQLGCRLAAALAAKGHTVHLLELWDGHTLPPTVAKTIQHTSAFADEMWMNTALENGSKDGSPVLLRLLRLCRHPNAVTAAFRQLVLKRPRRTMDTIVELEKLDAKYHFDAVCAVAAPYQGAFALEQANLGGRKFLWQMDPYGGNLTYAAPGGYVREAELLKHLNHVFLMPEALPDYQAGQPLATFAAKSSVLHLPFLIPSPTVSSLPHEGLYITFCGTLYPSLREPCFALSLFSALSLPDLTLTLAGGGTEHFSAAVQAAKKSMGSRLCLPGCVPLEQAKALQTDADVLLVLGNAMDNQISSKVFEYCATGKPVLYLASIENDPALPYIARYPLALVLYQKDGASPAVLEKLRQWLHQARGQHLPFEAVASLLPEFTPDRAAQDFEKVLFALCPAPSDKAD